jgi:hypothetical protein
MARATRLPRTDRSGARDLDEVEFLAWLLDNSIPIPGTGRRIGIDAIIGFVPGLGDILSGGLGFLVVLRGVQLGLPKVVIARMLANLGLDFVIGSIPVLGDAFDLWFKANSRNLRLMRRYVDAPGDSTAGQWLFFALIVGIVILIVAGALWVIGSILGLLFTEIG